MTFIRAAFIRYSLIIFIVFFFLVTLSNVGADDNGEITNWDNVSNITGTRFLYDVEMNSNNGTIYILTGDYLEEWGLENHTMIRSFHLKMISHGDMDYSPFMDLIAIVDSGKLSDGEPFSPLVIMETSGSRINRFEPFGELPPYNDASIVDLEWRPFKDHLAVLFQDGKLIIYNVTSNEILYETKYDNYGYCIKWSPSGEFLAIVTRNLMDEKDIEIYDLIQGTEWTIITKVSSMSKLEWSFDSNTLHLLYTDGLYSWSLSSSTLELIKDGGYISLISSPVEPIVVLIATQGLDFYNYQRNQTNRILVSHLLSGSAQWSEDGSYFYLIEEQSNNVRIWSRTVQMPKPRIGITGPIDGARVSGVIEISGWAESDFITSSFVLIKIGTEPWVPVEGFATWTYLLETTSFPDGPLYVRTKAIDPYGTSSVFTISVTIDNTIISRNPPTIRIDHPLENDELWGTVKVVGTATDDNSIMSVQISKNKLMWQSVSISGDDSTVIWEIYLGFSNEEGGRTIEARAFDGTLFSETVLINITIIKPPAFLANISIQYPEQGASVKSSFQVNGVVDDDADDPSVYVRIDDGPIVLADGSYDWQYTFENVTSGQHLVRAMFENNDGASMWVSVLITVLEEEGPIPFVIISYPINDSVLEGTVRIQGICGNITQVYWVEIRINSDEWIKVEGTDNWTYRDDNTYDQGWYKVEARTSNGESTSDIDTIRFYYVTDQEVSANVNDYFLITLVICLIVVIIILILRKKS